MRAGSTPHFTRTSASPSRRGWRSQHPPWRWNRSGSTARRFAGCPCRWWPRPPRRLAHGGQGVGGDQIVGLGIRKGEAGRSEEGDIFLQPIFLAAHFIRHRGPVLFVSGWRVGSALGQAAIPYHRAQGGLHVGDHLPESFREAINGICGLAARSWSGRELRKRNDRDSSDRRRAGASWERTLPIAGKSSSRMLGSMRLDASRDVSYVAPPACFLEIPRLFCF